MSNQYVFWRHDNKPILFLLVGLPGSGKSTVADKIYAENTNGMVTKPILHSSDNLRGELFGDPTCQEKNGELFKELHKRIKADLLKGENVIYDAANVNKKHRVAFLNELKKIPSYKQCICVMTPYETCERLNNNRERNAPESMLKKMYTNWMPPDYCEGFDSILPIYNYGDSSLKQNYTLKHLFKNIDHFDQKSENHDFTLGTHCRKTAEYIKHKYPNDNRLIVAALLHDNGKVLTQSEVNNKGEVDGQYHYYQHHCVGAYESMFYTDVVKMNYEDRIAVANLIYYHMHPQLFWQQSEKTLKRDVRLIGDGMYQNIMKLHDADLATRGPIRELEKEQSEDLTIERE